MKSLIFLNLNLKLNKNYTLICKDNYRYIRMILQIYKQKSKYLKKDYKNIKKRINNKQTTYNKDGRKKLS